MDARGPQHRRGRTRGLQEARCQRRIARQERSARVAIAPRCQCTAYLHDTNAEQCHASGSAFPNRGGERRQLRGGWACGPRRNCGGGMEERPRWFRRVRTILGLNG